MAPPAFSVSASGFLAHSPVTPAICSTFSSGRPVVVDRTAVQNAPKQRTNIDMKKGRSRQPMQPNRQQQQQEMSLPEDGTPVFAIFVRTPRAKMWYPLGAVKGDDRSKSLVNALKGRFAKGMYENALDKGIAQTVYGKDNNRFLQNALRMYPQLKKFSKVLEFGYRVAAVGLEDQKTKLVTREMSLPFMAWAKKKVDDVFKGGNGN